jgi:calcineurin-like phosphoesterase family protein
MKLEYNKNEVMFTSDTHYGHANIIKYCSRPFTFPDFDVMDKVMLDGFKEADEAGKIVFHMGDFVFNPKNLLEDAWRPKGKHYIILGNHDKHADDSGKYRKLYREYFHNIIGHSRTWKENSLKISVDNVRCILTHEPRQNISGVSMNIYGHHHNNMFMKPDYFKEEYGWLFNKQSHVNVGVELTNYKPVSWDEMLNLPRA